MDRSATWRVAPTRLNILPIFDDRRNCQVSAGQLEHLALTLFVVLGVVFDERDAVLVVVVPSALTVRTVRFDVHYDRHLILLYGFSLAERGRRSKRIR